MEAISREFRVALPWEQLYADDLAVIAETEEELKEVVREDCQARKLNKEDAMDRCKWRKVIKEAR